MEGITDGKPRSGKVLEVTSGKQSLNACMQSNMLPLCSLALDLCTQSQNYRAFGPPMVKPRQQQKQNKKTWAHALVPQNQSHAQMRNLRIAKHNEQPGHRGRNLIERFMVGNTALPLSQRIE